MSTTVLNLTFEAENSLRPWYSTCADASEPLMINTDCLDKPFLKSFCGMKRTFEFQNILPQTAWIKILLDFEEDPRDNKIKITGTIYCFFFKFLIVFFNFFEASK